MGYRGRLAAAFAAVFLIGALCGGAAGWVVNGPDRAGQQHRGARLEARFLDRLQKEGGLSAEQVKEAQPQISAMFTTLRERRRQAILEGDRLIDGMLADIANRLPAEQKSRLDDFRARRHAHLLRRISGD